MSKLRIADLREINEELKNDREMFGWNYKYEKPSNRFLDRLFNHWYLHEMVESFYDSEPEYDKDTYNKYYKYWSDYENIPKEERTEYKKCYDEILKNREDYDTKRIAYLTWQEPIAEGIWGMTQERCDNVARRVLERLRRFPDKLKGRFFVSRCEYNGKKMIRIYFYGRDLWERDYWFIFMKRKHYR